MMEKDIFDIIAEKNFEDLSTEEKKEFLSNFSSEEDYDGVKSFLSDLNAMTANQDRPSDKTKSRLNDLFDQEHSQQRPAWYLSLSAMIVLKDKPLYRQPLMYAAALILFLLLFVPIQDMKLQNKNDQMALNDAREKIPVVKQNEVVEMKEAEENIVTANKQEEPGRGGADLRDDSEMEFLTRSEGFSAIASGEGDPSIEPTPVPAQPTVVFSTFATPATSGSVTLAERRDTFDHPDGIYDDLAATSRFSVPASKQPELLDLLTATF